MGKQFYDEPTVKNVTPCYCWLKGYAWSFEVHDLLLKNDNKLKGCIVRRPTRDEEGILYVPMDQLPAELQARAVKENERRASEFHGCDLTLGWYQTFRWRDVEGTHG